MAKGQAVTKDEVVEILQTEMGEILLEFHERVFKKDIVKILLDFHKEVEEPMTEKILTRLDKIEGRLGKVEDGIEEVKIEMKNEVGRLERKLDQVTDHQAEKLNDHDGRIIRLEAMA